MAEDKEKVQGNGDATAAANNEQAASNMRFNIQRIYIKDSSFESPGTPECFRQPYNPKVDFSINTQSTAIEDNVYEVVLRLTAEVKQDEKTLFLAEVKQAGIFLIEGFASEQLNQVVNISCPSVLFPYGREALDAMIVKGGFPALMIAPVNFEALFQQARESRARQQQEEGNTQ